MTSSTPRPVPLGSSSDDDAFSWGEFLGSDVPKKLALLVGILALSRVGAYLRLPGVDVDAFAASMKSSGVFGYVDALSGGSVSKARAQHPCNGRAWPCSAAA